MSAVMAALRGHLSDDDVTADVTEFSVTYVTGEYESALSAVMAALRGHLSDDDVTADVTEFTFKQLLHDNTQSRDGMTFSLDVLLVPCLPRMKTVFDELKCHKLTLTEVGADGRETIKL